MGNKAIRTPVNVCSLGVAVVDHFHEVVINFHVGDCTGFVNSEGAADGSGVDNEAGHGFEKRIGWGGGLWCPPLLAILPHHRAELRSCAHIARRLVDALENTRSVWVMAPFSWMTRWRLAALAHCWRARRPMGLVWARLSSRAARCPPITLGLLSSRAATRSASPMKAAKRLEGMSLTMV